MSTYTRPRWGAIALFVAFAAGTGYVLFEDVLRHGAPFTTAHVLTGLALTAAIAAGHHALAELRGRHVLTALGCAVLFLAASGYIVTTSGARNAEVAANKTKRAEATIAERERITQLREKAQAMLDRALNDVADKCRGGDGKNCKGAKATRDVYEAAVLGHDARLARLAPASAAPNAGYVHAGHVFAALPFVTTAPAAITARLELLMPFILVLISELGTVVYGEMALRGRKRRAPAIALADSAQTSLPVPALFAHNEDDPPEPPGPGTREKKVRDFVAAHTARHGTPPRTRDVMRECALPKASASRWRAKALAA